MSKSRFQFGVRGLLILILAFACFFGGWSARERYGPSWDKQTMAEAWFSRERERYREQMIRHTEFQVQELEKENENLRQQNEVLEQMVETLNAEIEEINSVMDRPPSS